MECSSDACLAKMKAGKPDGTRVSTWEPVSGAQSYKIHPEIPVKRALFRSSFREKWFLLGSVQAENKQLKAMASFRPIAGFLIEVIHLVSPRFTVITCPIRRFSLTIFGLRTVA